jgi:hypothetical protein
VTRSGLWRQPNFKFMSEQSNGQVYRYLSNTLNDVIKMESNVTSEVPVLGKFKLNEYYDLTIRISVRRSVFGVPND